MSDKPKNKYKNDNQDLIRCLFVREQLIAMGLLNKDGKPLPSWHYNIRSGYGVDIVPKIVT